MRSSTGSVRVIINLLDTHNTDESLQFRQQLAQGVDGAGVGGVVAVLRPADRPAEGDVGAARRGGVAGADPQPAMDLVAAGAREDVVDVVPVDPAGGHDLDA